MCKCHPGFKLTDNLVTCTPISDEEAASKKLGVLPSTGSSEATNLDDLVIDEGNGSEAEDVLDSTGGEDDLEVTPQKATCPKGFKADLSKPSQCLDINECFLKISDCKAHQICINFNGGYRCVNPVSKTCDYGFAFNKETKKCEGKRVK